ncbi:MAG: hypothetical protein ACTSWY_09830 [Promethearchaeota archaeon]
MKCLDNTCEMDYYEEIIDFYEQTLDVITISTVLDDQIEKWSDFSYIKLMNEIKNEKELKEEIPIEDVAKNSIILILNLFDKRCQITSEIPLKSLPSDEKKKIREALLKALE